MFHRAMTQIICLLFREEENINKYSMKCLLSIIKDLLPAPVTEEREKTVHIVNLLEETHCFSLIEFTKKLSFIKEEFTKIVSEMKI